MSKSEVKFYALRHLQFYFFLINYWSVGFFKQKFDINVLLFHILNKYYYNLHWTRYEFKRDFNEFYPKYCYLILYFLDYFMPVKNCVCISILHLMLMELEAFWLWIMNKTPIVNIS